MLTAWTERIAIARALLRNPKVLLLDEVSYNGRCTLSKCLQLSVHQATSALDSTSEKVVQQVSFFVLARDASVRAKQVHM
jgi:ABC-type multidrug transport system fused ATPase/permease subunit